MVITRVGDEDQQRVVMRARNRNRDQRPALVICTSRCDGMGSVTQNPIVFRQILDRQTWDEHHFARGARTGLQGSIGGVTFVRFANLMGFLVKIE